MTDDAKVSQHVSRKYRELGAEAPPRALDDAILAAARRSARPWTKRWAVPLSLAAVIVLSVTVTLRIQHEQPGIESPVQQAAAPPAEQTAPSLAAAPPAPAASEPKPFAADQAVASARSDELRGAASGVTGGLVPQAGPARVLAKRAEAQANVQALKDADTPERELERIAQLRAQGRHDEADRALAEFRKRYPDYKIPEAMRERVERR